MSALLPLSSFTFETAPVPNKVLGKRGVLALVALSKLRIDDSYQRPIDAAGKKTIRAIIENFAWHKFAPLVVAPRKGGIFAVVDGQHRAVACALHGGIQEVPCLVLSCTPEEEAGAFATINGIVTRMHPQYLFRARIAAGDKAAVSANEAASAAGVKIMAYPVAASMLKVGETLSGRTIELEMARVGRAVLIAALELITRTGSGNAGLVKASIIEGFCDVYAANPKWLASQDEARRIVHRETVREILTRAIRRQADGAPGSLRTHIAAILSAALGHSLGDGGAVAIVTGGMRKRDEARKAAPPAKPNPAKPPKPVSRPVPIVVSDSRIKLRPQPKVGGGDPVSTAERAAIEAHLKTKGARRFDTADSGDDWSMCEWLTRKGHEVVRNTGQGKSRFAFKIDGKGYDRVGFLAFVNRVRVKNKLPPLGKAA